MQGAGPHPICSQTLPASGNGLTALAAHLADVSLCDVIVDVHGQNAAP